MGILALPFDNLASAKKFKKLMSKPWIAKVKYNSEFEYYEYKVKGLEIYSADDLHDYLGELADKKKKDFDIRDAVKTCLKYQTWWFENMYFIDSKLKLDIKAFNIVREVIKEKPFDKDKPLKIHHCTLKILEDLKQHKIKFKYVKFEYLKKGKKWNTYKRIPAKLKNQSPGLLSFSTKTSKNLKTLIKKIDKSIEADIFNFKGEQDVTLFYKEFKIDVKPKEKQLKSLGKTKVSLILKDKTSHKFWNAKVKGSDFIVEFGRVGSKPRISTKNFKSKELAISELNKKLAEKQKKGYKPA